MHIISAWHVLGIFNVESESCHSRKPEGCLNRRSHERTSERGEADEQLHSKFSVEEMQHLQTERASQMLNP